MEELVSAQVNLYYGQAPSKQKQLERQVEEVLLQQLQRSHLEQEDQEPRLPTDDGLGVFTVLQAKLFEDFMFSELEGKAPERLLEGVRAGLGTPIPHSSRGQPSSERGRRPTPRRLALFQLVVENVEEVSFFRGRASVFSVQESELGPLHKISRLICCKYYPYVDTGMELAYMRQMTARLKI